MTTATKKAAGAQSVRSTDKPDLPSLDASDLAARIFVKLYDPGGGRTAEHYAQQAIEAAETFLQTYEEHHR